MNDQKEWKEFSNDHVVNRPWPLRAQESLTLESRQKGIPLPKSKPGAPKAKPKAGAKAKAAANPDADGAEPKAKAKAKVQTRRPK